MKPDNGQSLVQQGQVGATNGGVPDIWPYKERRNADVIPVCPGTIKTQGTKKGGLGLPALSLFNRLFGKV